MSITRGSTGDYIRFSLMQKATSYVKTRFLKNLQGSSLLRLISSLLNRKKFISLFLRTQIDQLLTDKTKFWFIAQPERT